MTQRDYRTRVNSPSGTIADSDTFTYDDNGRMLTAVKGRYSNTVTFTYNSAGQIATEALTIGGNTYTITRDYDDAGMLNELTYPDGSIVTRDHTDRNELHKVHYDADGTGSGTPVTIDTRTYDDGGRLTNIAHGNGLSTAFSYRDDNLVSSIDVTGATGLDFTYTWDANKNKLTEVINAPMNDYGFTATYDDEDRLLTWERDDGNLDQSWSLSAVGNWNSFTENTVTETRTHSDAHELTAIGSTSLTYDAKGNLTTNVNSHTYTWDMDNMLKSATVPSGSTEGTVGTHEYEYDALGRRVAKVVEESGTTTTTLFIQKTTPIAYSPYAGQTLAEYEFTTGSPALVRKYAYGDYIDEPLVLINVSGASETMYYYHRNQQYSVCGLTDGGGATVELNSYDCYGNHSIFDSTPTQISATAYGNTFSYTGREHATELRTLYFRYRTFDPSIGRFLSRDPLSYTPGLNLYSASFVPAHLDPLGLEDMGVMSGAAAGVTSYSFNPYPYFTVLAEVDSYPLINGITAATPNTGSVMDRVLNNSTNQWIPMSRNLYGAQGHYGPERRLFFVDPDKLRQQGVDFLEPHEVRRQAFLDDFDQRHRARLRTWRERQYPALKHLRKPLSPVISGISNPSFRECNIYQFFRGGEREALARNRIPAEAISRWDGLAYNTARLGGRGLLVAGTAYTGYTLYDGYSHGYSTGDWQPFGQTMRDESASWSMGGSLALGGAAIGSAAGPLGTAIGGGAGGVLGGILGATMFNPDIHRPRERTSGEAARRMRCKCGTVPRGIEYDRYLYGHFGGARQ